MFGGIATTFAEKDLLYVNKVELRSCAGTTHNHYMCQRNGIHTHGKNKEVERGSILGLYFVCEAIYIYILYVKNETFYGRHFSRGYTTSIVCVTVSVCVCMLCYAFNFHNNWLGSLSVVIICLCIQQISLSSMETGSVYISYSALRILYAYSVFNTDSCETCF